MKVLKAGHIYELDHLDGSGKTTIHFVERPYPHKEDKTAHEGVQSQELLRVLIDRTGYLDKELPHPLNADIIKHLRLALQGYEARHLAMKQQVGIENAALGADGHLLWERKRCLKLSKPVTPICGLCACGKGERCTMSMGTCLWTHGTRDCRRAYKPKETNQ